MTRNVFSAEQNVTILKELCRQTSFGSGDLRKISHPSQPISTLGKKNSLKVRSTHSAPQNEVLLSAVERKNRTLFSDLHTGGGQKTTRPESGWPERPTCWLYYHIQLFQTAFGAGLHHAPRHAEWASSRDFRLNVDANWNTRRSNANAREHEL